MVKKSARRTRRTHNPAFNARVALAALSDKTMAELCKEYELHPTQITEWKRQLLEVLPGCLAAMPSQSRWILGHCTPR